MSANNLLSYFGFSSEDITSINKILNKFKKDNKDPSISEEDLTMDIITGYLAANPKNFISFGAAIGYYSIVKQLRKNYSIPANFNYVSFPDTSYINKDKLQRIVSKMKQQNDIEALEYINVLGSLVLSHSKITKTMIRNKLGITAYEQNKIIKRIKTYYG